MKTWKVIGSRLALVGGALIGALLVLEGIARVYFKQRLGDAIGVPDDDLLYAANPGARLVFRHREQKRLVFTDSNSAGFRGPELGPRVSGRARIALYGDSMLMAIEVDFEDTFGEQLSGLLSKAGIDNEVVNAALIGYGPDQALLRFEREVEDLQPDAVILGICTHNDFGDLIRNRLFFPSETGALLPRKVVMHPAFRENFEKQQAKRRLPILWRSYLEWTHVPIDRAKPLTSKEFFEKQEIALVRQMREYRQDKGPVTPSFTDGYDLDLALSATSGAALLKLRILHAVLSRFQRTCAERGIEFLLLVIPSPVDVTDSYLHQVDTERYPEYTRRALTERYLNAAAALDLPAVELFAPLREAGPEQFYMPPPDIHWNEVGNRKAAEIVATWFLDVDPRPAWRARRRAQAAFVR